jgi:exodeoxyribonuclease-3
MGEYKVVSYNVRGLRNIVKRTSIFAFLKDKANEGIVCLQETHSSPEIHSSWRGEWKNEAYFNDGTSNSAGVAVLFTLQSNYEVVIYFNDKNGCLQILSIILEGAKLLVVNIYNYNHEKEQVDLLVSLNDALDNFDYSDDHKIILAGDFNFIYDLSLDSRGGNPSLKLKSLAEITRIREKLDLCDIFRVRFPNSKRYTFRTKNGKICRQLDHFLISNEMQECVSAVGILPSIRSDHSPIILSLRQLEDCKRGPGMWKFNNLLLENETFCTELKEEIEKFTVEHGDIVDHQIKWELLKYVLRAHSIKFSKKLAKKKKKTYDYSRKRY